MQTQFSLLVAFIFGLSFAANSNLVAQDKAPAMKSKDRRVFAPVSNPFRARGISYGPFRKGQSPQTGVGPTKRQIIEDLQILKKDQWQMIRTYGTESFARLVCEVIRAEKLELKLMLGAWIATEKNDAKTKNGESGSSRSCD